MTAGRRHPAMDGDRMPNQRAGGGVFESGVCLVLDTL
jgi:hypothetical protein